MTASGSEFGHRVTAILRLQDLQVDTPPIRGENGVDLIASRHAAEGGSVRTAVRVMPAAAPVGPRAVQEVVAGKAMYRCAAAWVVTAGTFTQEAKRLAASNAVRLVDGVEFLAMETRARRGKQPDPRAAADSLERRWAAREQPDARSMSASTLGLIYVFLAGAGIFVLFSRRPDPTTSTVAIVLIVAPVIIWMVVRRLASRYSPTDRAVVSGVGDERQLLETVGTDNAALVSSTLAAVLKVSQSEAAREGWLGDIDFGPDIRTIIDNFRTVHALKETAERLSVLDSPTEDDQRILAEAKTTASKLESAALERIELINKCAAEALLLDESLRKERADAHTAAQREELHAELTGMLYGIEASPNTNSPESAAAETVMARVRAYREIKDQIRQARSE